MALSNYLAEYRNQAEIEHKRAQEIWLKQFFEKFRDNIRENNKLSPGDRNMVPVAVANALPSLIPNGFKVICEDKLNNYIEFPKNKEFCDLLGKKRVDFSIIGEKLVLLVEFKTNIQFNDIAAAMIEMAAVKKFVSKNFGKKLLTSSLHLYPYRSNVEGLRQLNIELGSPLDFIWVFCTPAQQFDIEAIRQFRYKLIEYSC